MRGHLPGLARGVDRLLEGTHPVRPPDRLVPARPGDDRGLVWRAGWLKDQGKPSTTETSIAKLYATEAAVKCADLGIQVHGGSGYVDDYPVERYLRDARVTTLYEGTSQIQKLIIGRAYTGLNALVP
jgi:alkylation response protein AidB-like acyl-CoA dehydrogenase